MSRVQASPWLFPSFLSFEIEFCIQNFVANFFPCLHLIASLRTNAYVQTTNMVFLSDCIKTFYCNIDTVKVVIGPIDR